MFPWGPAYTQAPSEACSCGRSCVAEPDIIQHRGCPLLPCGNCLFWSGGRPPPTEMALGSISIPVKLRPSHERSITKRHLEHVRRSSKPRRWCGPGTRPQSWCRPGCPGCTPGSASSPAACASRTPTSRHPLSALHHPKKCS